MVDKKLSEFSSVQASDVSDLVVLYLDGNNTTKNGRLPFSTFVSGLALLSGNNTFTGDNTFSGDVVFEETATFNKPINGTAARATADASGNNIANTYATKTELAQKSSFKLFHHDWFDYQLNDMDWLRADTFSWQDGSVYTAAYNHLVDDNEGATEQSETIGSYTIYYRLASDGHKIVMPDQATTVANIYNESGVAWYYILDTANQRFKLPRELPITDKSKGNGMTLGLTNGTDNFALTGASSNSIYQYLNGYGTNVGTTVSGGGVTTTLKSTGLTTDPTKSGIISHRANENGQQYLYFYVGQFSQSATEQTAGLNSELFNGKLDLNAANLSTAGKSLISGLGMPSGRYDDLTLGSSGTEYTAPANGYFCLMKNSNAGGQNIALNNNTNPGLSSFATNNATTQALRCFIPVHKNDIMAVGYTAGGAVQWFRFYYAEGEPSV